MATFITKKIANSQFIGTTTFAYNGYLAENICFTLKKLKIVATITMGTPANKGNIANTPTHESGPDINANKPITATIARITASIFRSMSNVLSALEPAMVKLYYKQNTMRHKRGAFLL